MVFRRIVYPALPVLTMSSSYGQEILRYRFQLYDEEDGRIDVESHYLDYKHSWGATTASLRLAIDRLSGETPVGIHARGDDSDWLFQEIDDERRVGVATIEHELDDYTLTFEYAHSKEEDYRSNAVTAKVSRKFNQKNTTLTGGVSFAYDEVLTTDFTSNFENEDKDALNFSLGLSQIVTPNTLADFTLEYGRSKGYLSDPYRRISQFRTVVVDGPFGPIPVTDTFDFPENRPNEQHHFVAKASVRQYFEAVNGALNFSYRFFANSDSLEGHSLKLKWIQQVNDRLSVAPYLRYYQQSEADYYYATLTNAGVDGTGLIDGSGANYSSDYRLSKMGALTYGIRVIWEPRSDLTLDLQLERYEMNGLDSQTPSSFFPTANVVSVGAQWSF
ncbi:MAG: hypothetical protein ACJAT6_000222 [Akkermansiaceae bacterium]|jgi:hypothetical protein|tara:strand:- start:3 stop:1166 length:1164 start_codon:yes stop_codon:yes gene_type:complete